MGWFAKIRRVFSKRRGFVDIPLDEGEALVLDVHGCLIKHRTAWKRGQLRLTDQRLLIRPWRTNDIDAIVRYGLPAADSTPDVAVVGTLHAMNHPVNRRVHAGANAITEVSRGRPPSLLRAPTIVLTMADGHKIEIGVVATATAPNKSVANIAAREHLLADLQSV
jgi:hypothetical protein